VNVMARTGYHGLADFAADGGERGLEGGQLYISEATVKAHVSRQLAKLDATNRVQIAMVVHDAGLA
jgi:hypothetical protein